MDNDFARAMKQALDQTRSGDPMAATRSIQAALGGFGTARPDAAPVPGTGPIIDRVARRAPDATAARAPAGMRMRLGKVVGLLREGIGRIVPHGSHPTPHPAPDGPGRWERRRHQAPEGARDYRLYVPDGLTAPKGLVVMLHGCTQTPEDFAAGTTMNAHADRAGLIVVYPEQPRGENAQRCWNWFRPGDQGGAAGEPAILAGMALAVAAEFDVPPDRIFAAGLSAGGAMAAILGLTRPEVFSAVAIHSGLPAGAARDVASAFAAMKGGPLGPMPQPPRGKPARTLILHGSADQTVSPANGRALYAAMSALGGTESVEPGLTGRSWRRSTRRDADGRPLSALIEIDGLGHAWSGGDRAGSYTDPTGPDASAEMVRFFLG